MPALWSADPPDDELCQQRRGSYGICALNNDVLEQTGKEFGADGIELSAHALCAEDHLPYQGRQFSMEEFETIQMRLRRPIGMWNCKHTRHPIILGISEPAYSPEQLERLRRNSSQQITIDGDAKTRYEWTQEQRRIETAIRQQDDILTMAKAAGDSVSRIEAERNIQQLIRRYDDLSEKVGLELRYDRTVGHAVYKPNVTKSLKKPAHGDIMNLKKAGIVFPPSMDPVKYKKMCEKLLANGIQVIAAEADDLRFLEFMGAEAMALGTNVILHQRKIPSASAFFEEIIHIYQNRTLGELKENDFVERARREIEANRKLVKYAVSYGLTSADKSDIERNLRTWEEDYERRSGHKYE